MRADNSMKAKRIYTFGSFRVDVPERFVESAGSRLSLAPKALDVLIVLIENRGRTVEKEFLMNQVWPDTFVEDNSLAFNISVLRKLFGDNGASSQYIETVPRRGYRFVADVVEVSGQDLAGLDTSPHPSLPARSPDHGRVATRDRNRWALVAFGALLLATLGWAIKAWSSSRFGMAGPPVVILMDTSAPMGVYDPSIRKKSGTNADVISDELRDLPLALHKETVGSAWDREDQVLKQNPALIVVHRSAFFHAMDLDLQLGYPPYSDSDDLLRSSGNLPPLSRLNLFVYLLAVGDNRLELFLGYAGSTNPKTRFLVYSRGSAREWARPAYRHDWVENLERRFPLLKGRVFGMNVEGGENGRLQDPLTAANLRKAVCSILGLNSSGTPKSK